MINFYIEEKLSKFPSKITKNKGKAEFVYNPPMNLEKFSKFNFPLNI